MNVTDKEQIERVVEHLRVSSESEKDYTLRSAIINVCSVLEQAIELYEDWDDQHPHVMLELLKVQTIFDTAIEVCCTTDCIYYQKGTCPYIFMKDKEKCQRIQGVLYGSVNLDDDRY